jgi:D-glycero-D-manno-heptose 1,7-bisphosphate phosphatase
VSAETPRPAIFLDRDGVIIENKSDYVKSLADVHFIPGALTALAALVLRMRDSGRECRVVMVTNQSAIGRGLVMAEAVEAVNEHVVRSIAAAGGRIDGVYVCPHAPEAKCACRKPAPGMLLQAAAALGIDLHRSIMIGDAVSDVLAAHAAGARAILVRTGRGASEAPGLARANLGYVPVVSSLPAALDVGITVLLNAPADFTKTPPVEGGGDVQATRGILP